MSARHWTIVKWLAVAAIVFATAGFAGWNWLRPLPKLRDIERRAGARQWELADAAATEYVARRPRDADGLLLAARVAAGRGELERCVSLLERVPRSSPLKIEALLRQAQALQELIYGRRQEQAWLELVRVAERHAGKQAPPRVTAQEELVAFYFLERRADDARALVWQMYPAHREKWRLLITLARIEGKPADAAQVRPVLEQFVALDPDDAPAHRALAMYAMNDRPDDAVAAAQHCLSLDPSDAAALEILLEAYMRLNLWQEVDPLLARDDLAADRPRLWRLRGQWHLQQGRPTEAVAAFRESLRLAPFDATAHYQLGQALRHGDTFDEAQAQIRRSNELRQHQESITTFLNAYVSDDPRAWEAPPPDKCVDLADHCRALGRLAEARGWLEEALRQQPDSATARELLEQIAQPSPRSDPPKPL